MPQSMTIYFPINFDPPRKVIPQLPLVLGLSWPLTSHLQTPQGHKKSHHHSSAFDRWIGHEARPAEGQRCWHEGQIPSIRREKNTSWLLVFRMDFWGVGFWGLKNSRAPSFMLEYVISGRKCIQQRLRIHSIQEPLFVKSIRI